jgi:hypothetical protein
VRDLARDAKRDHVWDHPGRHLIWSWYMSLPYQTGPVQDPVRDPVRDPLRDPVRDPVLDLVRDLSRTSVGEDLLHTGPVRDLAQDPVRDPVLCGILCGVHPSYHLISILHSSL